MHDTAVHYISVHGTWDLGEDAWWRHGSSFCKFAGENGLHCEEEHEPFFWSGAIDGVGFFGNKHETWMASGLSLKNRLRLSKREHRNLILHSHALQNAAYADIEVNNIITVGSPIREDMADLYLKLRKRCNKWLHIYDASWDKMGFLGQMFDGRWFGGRDCPLAHFNDPLKKIGHSSILRDQKAMQNWVTRGWFHFLKTGEFNGQTKVTDSGGLVQAADRFAAGKRA